MNYMNTLDAITRSLRENQRYQSVLLNDLQRQIDDLRSELATKVSFTIGTSQTYTTAVNLDTSNYED
mgnify:CR=1 FL=1